MTCPHGNPVTQFVETHEMRELGKTDGRKFWAPAARRMKQANEMLPKTTRVLMVTISATVLASSSSNSPSRRAEERNGHTIVDVVGEQRDLADDPGRKHGMGRIIVVLGALGKDAKGGQKVISGDGLQDLGRGCPRRE